MNTTCLKSYGSLLDICTLVAVHLINKCSKDSLQQYCLASSSVRVKEYGFPLGVIRLVEDIENFSDDLKAIIVILINSYLLDIATWEALSKRINRKVLHENFHNLVIISIQDASLFQREMFIRILSDESSYRAKKQMPNTTRSGNYIMDTIALRGIGKNEETSRKLCYSKRYISLHSYG
ncbi:hypothetical protein SNEBB_001066 [Seison nebaliae]|nr:hypothetical protein SNEBB_001066 [Seison nebaliae]